MGDELKNERAKMIHLFQSFYLRKNKAEIYLHLLILLGGIISSALLAVVIFATDNIESYSIRNSYLINHGDLFISQKKMPFDDIGYDERNTKFQAYLDFQEGIQYSVEENMLCFLDSAIGVADGYTMAGRFYWYRLVDFKDIGRYARLTEMPDRESVVISQSLARRLSASEGDMLRITFLLEAPALTLPISSVVPDNAIHLYNSNWGYLLIDQDYFREWYDQNCAGVQSKNRDGFPQYYIDGDSAQLQKIARKADQIFEGYSEAVFASDMNKEAYQFFRLPVAFLTFFSLICFILHSFSVMNLLHLKTLKIQKDVAILKVLGMKNRQEIAAILTEMLVLFLPVYIIGIGLGYLFFRHLLHQTSSLGLFSLTVSEFWFSVVKILFINVGAVLLFCFLNLFYVCKRNITDILRGNHIHLLLKRQLFFVILAMMVCILFLFGVIIKSSDVIYLLLALFTAIVFLFLLCILAARLMRFVKTRSLSRISLSFLFRNKTRVPITIITYTLCFVMIFVMVLADYSLSSLASDAVFQTFDYNVEIKINPDRADLLEEKLRQHSDSYNYYTIYSYPAAYQEKSFMLDFYDFSRYHGTMKDKIKADIGIGEDIYRGQPELSIGTVMDIGFADSVNRFSFKLDHLQYRSPITRDGNTAAGVLADPYQDRLSDRPEDVSYFFKVSGQEEEHLREIVNENEGMILITPEDVTENQVSALWDYQYLLNRMTLYFVLCTFIVVLTCSVITYTDRNKDFCIYSVLGADKKRLWYMILLENLIITAAGCLGGTMIAVSILKWIGQILAFPLSINFKVLGILIALFFMLSVMISILIIRIVPFQSIIKFIREGDE